MIFKWLIYDKTNKERSLYSCRESCKVTDMYEFRTVFFMQLSVGAQAHTLLYRQTPIKAGWVNVYKTMVSISTAKRHLVSYLRKRHLLSYLWKRHLLSYLWKRHLLSYLWKRHLLSYLWKRHLLSYLWKR